MKFKDIYDLLNEAVIIDSYDKYLELNSFKIESHIKTQKLFNQLKKEVLKEAAKDSGTNKEAAAINKILNQKYLETRPILKKAIKRNGYIEFTDSYILGRLKKDIKGIEFVTPEEFEKYPKFDRLVPETNFKVTINTQKIKEDLSLLKKDNIIYKIDLPRGGFASLDKKYIDAMIKILGFKNDDDINFNFIFEKIQDDECYIRPITIFNDNDDMILILPMRTN